MDLLKLKLKTYVAKTWEKKLLRHIYFKYKHIQMYSFV